MINQEDYHFLFDTNTTSNEKNKVLSAKVSVYSTYGFIWSTSNSAQVTTQKFGTVTFNYLDMSGNRNLEPKTINGLIGTTYENEPYKINIDGYTFEYVEGKNENEFKEELIEIYFYYKAIEVNRMIEIKYVDQKGKELHAPVTFDGLVGTVINLLDYPEHKKTIEDVLQKNYLLNDENRPIDELNYTIKIENNQIIK